MKTLKSPEQFSPEGCWKLAGGETTGHLPGNQMHPGRAAGNPRIPAPLPGCEPCGNAAPVVAPPANFQHASGVKRPSELITHAF